MKTLVLTVILLIFSVFTSCEKMKPENSAALISEPWAALDLPCKNEGMVVFSNEQRFNCAYAGATDRERAVQIIKPYAENLKRQGWIVTKDLPDVAVQYVLEKDGREILLTSTAPSVIVSGQVVYWDGLGIQLEIWSKE